MTLRFADVDVDRARTRVNLFYRFAPNFQAGLEWNPGERELGPVANWILAPESKHRPMTTVGTSSDRIFSPRGTQAYYATLAKSLPWTGSSAYVSFSYSEWEDTLLVPFGSTFEVARQWDLTGMHDGRNTHALVTYKMPEANVSFLMIKMRYPGISLGFGF
ncbi:MAG: hypothetical protein M9921_08005 [Fimbriimonadaceae bacterium]|nr:hypothetical protein [Chthonomonadaceae bacterium]MCO5296785.1 hypothetical protein [Fimbriimonadaceae bacterium]